MSTSNQSATIGPLMQKITIGKWDITEFVLGGSVVKTLRQPTGQWSLRLRPTILNNTNVDLDQIMLNDFCEIRVGRNLVSTPSGPQIPILMRGLVDTVEIGESYSQSLDGNPDRTVTISGRDLAKLIVDKSLFVPQEFTSENSIARQTEIFALQRKVDPTSTIGGKAAPAGATGDTQMFSTFQTFIEGIIGKIFTEPLVGLDIANNVKFAISCNLPKDDQGSQGAERLRTMSGYSLSGFKGSLFNYIEFYIPRPFMEFFINDYEDRTELKVRWAPFRDVYGEFPAQAGDHMKNNVVKYWFDVSKDPMIMEIDRREILQKTIRRHSEDRYTYFLTTWGAYQPQYNADGASQAILASSNKQATGASNERDLAELLTSASPGAKKYINENQKFNPQYDFQGMRRFGIKPLVVPVNFWTQQQIATQAVSAGVYTTSVTGGKVAATVTGSPYVPGSTTAATSSYSVATKEMALASAIAIMNDPSKNQTYKELRDGKIATFCEKFTADMYQSTVRYESAWANALINRTKQLTSQLEAGDLVYFQPDVSNGYWGHVGIMVDDTSFISALDNGIVPRSLYTTYWLNLFYGGTTGAYAYGKGKDWFEANQAKATAAGLIVTGTGGAVGVRLTEEARTAATKYKPNAVSGLPTSSPATATSAVATAGTVSTAPVTKGKDADLIFNLLDDLNQWLFDVFRQTDQYYIGQIQLIGNPFIKIGMEIAITQGKPTAAEASKTVSAAGVVEFVNQQPMDVDGFTYAGERTVSVQNDKRERYYVESVEHSWSFSGTPSFQTRISVSRGIFVSRTNDAIKNKASDTSWTATQSDFAERTKALRGTGAVRALRPEEIANAAAADRAQAAIDQLENITSTPEAVTSAQQARRQAEDDEMEAKRRLADGF